MPRRSDQGPDGARYRAAPRYTIVAPRDLPRAVASRFQLLDAVPDATAVLLPRDGTVAGAWETGERAADAVIARKTG